MTEFMNTTDKAIKIPAGEIIGHAKFVKDKQWGSKYYHTQMAACQFDPDQGLGEAPPSTDPKESGTTQDPHSSQDPEAPHETLFACNTEDAPTDIPPGAKPLSVDLSGICEEAEPYREELENLLKVKHEAAFSKHDRDYGKTWAETGSGSREI